MLTVSVHCAGMLPHRQTGCHLAKLSRTLVRTALLLVLLKVLTVFVYLSLLCNNLLICCYVQLLWSFSKVNSFKCAFPWQLRNLSDASGVTVSERVQLCTHHFSLLFPSISFKIIKKDLSYDESWWCYLYYR